jgi:hypothetical protein
LSPGAVFAAWEKARRVFTDALEREFKLIVDGTAGQKSRQQRERDRAAIRRLGERERRLYAAYARKADALGLSGPGRFFGPRAVVR